MAPYAQDWTGAYPSAPGAVIRPGSTEDVSQVMKIAAQHRVAVVPLGGNTGLVGGGQARGELIISLERLNNIRAIKPGSRVAIVEAGVILQQIHDAVAKHDLIFPLTFGARGSARIGGCLSTNAGGSNVVKYGATRGLCLGLEVVLASGEVLDLMGELHKDNSGYALRELFIGAEGTLGIITAAVLKLSPKPEAYATAQVAFASIDTALDFLSRLQRASSNAVEAYEYMPRSYLTRLKRHRPDLYLPIDDIFETNVMIELGGPSDLQRVLEEHLTQALDNGEVKEAVIAQNETQRQGIWACREAAGEIIFDGTPSVVADICLPLDKITSFLTIVRKRLSQIEDNMEEITVAHLGDGNLHFAVYPKRDAPGHHSTIQAEIDAVTVEHGGSISAEHGIGQSKRLTLKRHKDPVALKVMSAVKQALDPEGRLNPGKVIPPLT